MPHEHDPLRAALVSPPLRGYDPFDPKAHGLLDRCDWTRAASEHQALLAELGEARVQVEQLQGDAAHPEHIAPAASGLVVSEGVLLGRSGVEAKGPNEDRVLARLKTAGVPMLARIQEPGTFAGVLDCIVLGDYAFLGKAPRSNESGRNQATRALAEHNIKTDLLPVAPYGGHLCDVLSVLDEDTLLVHPRIAEERSVKDWVLLRLPEDEPTGGSVLPLGRGRVLVHEGNRKTRRIVEGEGFDVSVVDLTETIRTGFGPRHLVLPLKRG